MTKVNMLNSIFRMQDEMNTVAIGENWKNEAQDWRLAMALESAELIESMPWKWWKNSEADIDNAKIETVDILHFAISLFTVEMGDNASSIERLMIRLEEDSLSRDSVLDGDDEIVENAKLLMRQTLDLTNAEDILVSVINLSYSLGMDWISLAKLYTGKNVLNKFRQDNGYKEGTYTKTWNGEEDNVYMQNSVSSIALDENFGEELYATLTVAYEAL